MDVLIGVAFVILLIAFWLLQMRSGYLSTRYFLQLGFLLIIGLAGLYLAGRIVAGGSSWAALILAILPLGLAIYHLTLGFFKLTTESDSRYRRLHKANRALVAYNCPHERFSLRTQDGVRLQGLSLTSNALPSDKVVIVCHGAGRSKNTIPVVQTCELLATKYHVFTFDFRGHMESGGTFKADGDTEYDLQAMIEYVEKAGYKKIAVVGWSIGAWTALLSASKGCHIDAIVAGSPPPIDIAQTRQIGLLRRFIYIGIFIQGGVAVIRNLRTRLGNYVWQIMDFARKVPPIPVLLVYNDYDQTSRVGTAAFEQLYEHLSANKERLILPGTGHLFDWPNTFFLWNKVFEWLEHNF